VAETQLNRRIESMARNTLLFPGLDCEAIIVRKQIVWIDCPPSGRIIAIRALEQPILRQSAPSAAILPDVLFRIELLRRRRT
jgi:hypothetical protein